MQIKVRNRSFDMEHAPRQWHRAGRSVTLFYNNLSVFFPHGEHFFIRSVRKHLAEVDEPFIRDAARAFCGQEAMHRREHARYNAMLEAQGYPADELEAGVERLLALVTRVLPDRWQLSATCALEHHTALLGHFLLNDPTLLDGADAEMAELWRWHAVEENEHKAVAFDVYEAVGAPYAERAGIMALASVIFWVKLLEYQVRMMHADGIAASPREWWTLGKYLFGKKNRVPAMVRPFLDYFKPSFHPWDHNNVQIIEDWRAANAPAPELAPQPAP